MTAARKGARLHQAKIVRANDRVDSEGKKRSKGFGFIEFENHEVLAIRCSHPVSCYRAMLCLTLLAPPDPSLLTLTIVHTTAGVRMPFKLCAS